MSSCILGPTLAVVVVMYSLARWSESIRCSRRGQAESFKSLDGFIKKQS